MLNVKTFAVGSGPNRLLRFGLGVLVLIMCLIALRNLLLHYPWGVDVVIPLKAATRWLAGGQPYLASSFLNGPGYDLPYLYPPFVLPFVALFTSLPQTPVIVGWFVLSVAAALFACRRLAIPWPAIPFLFVWPPFTEGLLGGNVQVVVFAAFVAFLWRSPRPARPGRASSRSSTTRPVRTDPAGGACSRTASWRPRSARSRHRRSSPGSTSSAGTGGPR